MMTKESARPPWVEVLQQICMGGTAGVVAKTACSPMERIKLLSQTGFGNHGLLQLISDVFREEGPRGLWRGNSINCIRVFPNKGILFASNDMYKSLFDERFGDAISTTLQGFLTGACAGTTAVIFTYPLDVIRTRRAGILGGTNPKYATLMGTARMIFQKSGFRGFFAGLPVTISGAIPYEGMKFGIYPIIKSHFPQGTANDHKWKLLSGSLTGMFAGTATYHFDTIRRVRQVSGASGVHEYSGTFDAYRSLLREGGIRRLYRGVLVNIVRIIPNTGLQFFVFETLKEEFHGKKVRKTVRR